MKIAILAGGPDSNLINLSESILRDAQWIGVDRGTLTLLEYGITPIRAFGDFDSISSVDFTRISESKIPLSTFEAEKDKTDLELALQWALQQNPDECYLIGATGGRLDHALLNVQLLLHGQDSLTPIYLVDKQNIVTLLNPGSYTVEKRPEFHYISFIAYTPQILKLSLSGFKYPLKDHLLKWGSSLCISNEFVGLEGTVSFSEGLLLLIQSRD